MKMPALRRCACLGVPGWRYTFTLSRIVVTCSWCDRAVVGRGKEDAAALWNGGMNGLQSHYGALMSGESHEQNS